MVSTGARRDIGLMAVWCLQSVNGEADDPVVIDPEGHLDLAGDDLALLHRKAQSAAANGWEVTWNGERSFTAVKDRWGGSLCARDFWTD